jgi:4a-hydroxytetrahydrobiopterin dehydratase
MERLSKAEIAEGLATLDGWHLDDGRIAKSFRFPSFSEAFAFMTAAALHAEALNHHPEWSNVYDRVEVALTTHSAKGLTALDFKLARRMDRLFGRLG